MPAGYSLNPLSKKLGMKEGHVVKLINAPSNYRELIGEIENELIFDDKKTKDIDFIHFFTNSISELERVLPKLKTGIKKDGVIWVSWFKKAAKSRQKLLRIL